jgi:uncharacterized repeat protein (TIGR03943 family)
MKSIRLIIVVMLLGYLGYALYSGQLANYINLRFQWLSWVALVILLLMLVNQLIALVKPNGLHVHEHDHEHSPTTWYMLAIMGVPLVLGIAIPSAPLGAEAIRGSVSTVGFAPAVSASTFNIAPEKRNVLDWVRVISDSADWAEFDGQAVDVSGFVYREPNVPEGQFMIARFTMSCCVADASALALFVEVADAEQYADGDWVQVTGEMDYRTVEENPHMVIFASNVTPIPVPEQPYLYP